MRRAGFERGHRTARWAALVALSLAACAAPRVSLREAPRAFTASDYEDVYARWTRAEDAFDFGRLSEVLHVTATFESWEFRHSYVTRYAADHAFTTDERTALLSESLADARATHRFFVTLSVPLWREGDLTGRQSDLRVLLVDGTGHQVAPVELRRLGRPSHDQRAYFPSISRQRHTFRIAFPAVGTDGAPTLAPDSTELRLRFASARGTVDLRWDVDRESP